jgi:glycosyltransferase involved in cell wall biosynthesis
MQEKNKKHILFITTGLGVGGAEIVLSKLVFGLKDDFQLEVISLVGKGDIATKIRAAGIVVHELNFTNIFSVFANFYKFYLIIAKFKPDIIQGWMYLGNLFACFARLFYARTAKLFFGIRQSLGHIFVNKWSTLVIVFLGALFSRKADEIIYNSVAGKNDHEKYGYVKKNSIIIDNGVDTEVFCPVSNNHDLLCDELGISHHSFLIGTIGRLHPVKDYQTFIKAADIMVSLNDKTHFIMVGSNLDNDNKFFKDLIKLYPKLKERVHLLGQRTDIPYIMSSLDIFTNCSLSEGVSNCLGEALSCGVICVATDAGDARRIIGDVGIVVPTRNPQELALAWQKVIGFSQEKRVEYSRLARQKIKQQYSLEQMISNYKKIYTLCAG